MAQRKPAPSGSERLASDALRRSWVAARLNGVRSADVPKWTQEQGLPTASATTFERVVGPVRASSPLKGQRGRQGHRQLKADPQIWDWLLVDEDALGLLKVLYRLPNDGSSQEDLLDTLQHTIGVRQILEAESDRELIVVALLRNRQEARQLRNGLEELAPNRAVNMDIVSWENWKPAARTWQSMAEAEAKSPRR